MANYTTNAHENVIKPIYCYAQGEICGRIRGRETLLFMKLTHKPQQAISDYNLLFSCVVQLLKSHLKNKYELQLNNCVTLIKTISVMLMDYKVSYQ